jgi:hypothetical protein
MRAMLRVLLKVTDKDDYDWVRTRLLRRRLAGSALRRERRVTTNPLPPPVLGGDASAASA